MKKLFNKDAATNAALLFAAAAAPCLAGTVGSIPLVSTLNNLSGNVQAAAYACCLIGGTAAMVAAIRHHHDWGAIGTGAMGVLSVSALALGMSPALALVGVSAGII